MKKNKTDLKKCTQKWFAGLHVFLGLASGRNHGHESKLYHNIKMNILNIIMINKNESDFTK